MPAVRDIMSTPPTTIEASAPASAAAQLMRDTDVGFLPVLSGGRLEGTVTDRDLAIEGLTRGPDVRVEEIMSRNPVAIAPTDDIADAERLMSEHAVRRLLVCEGGRLVGVVSVGDLATRASRSAAGDVMHETGPSATAGGTRAASPEHPEDELNVEAPGLGAEMLRSEGEDVDQEVNSQAR